MEDWVNKVKLRAKTGKAPIRGGKGKVADTFSFDNLVFIPAQVAKRPLDYFREEIKAETIIGKTAKHPIKIKTPIMIAAMSHGALSKEAKIALAMGSKLAGTVANTGEGGMVPEERKEADILIAQYASGRFGVNEQYFKLADAIEIKLGQGAKPGQGGLLEGFKVTEEIVKIRGVQEGKDVHSPPAHPDIITIEDLKKRVAQIKTSIGGKPVIIKIGAGNIEEDIELALQANPDVIAIDGMSGGTGAAPEIMLDDFGIPILVALVKARKLLDKVNAKQQLIVGGGFYKGSSVAKALALGADAVFMGMPMLVAMGCGYCQLCYKGKCPFGITTQDLELRKKLNVEGAAKNIANFINACTEEVKMAAAACGYDDVHKLNKDDIRTTSYELHKITGIDTV